MDRFLSDPREALVAQDPSFPDLIRRLRKGDQEAAAELVQRYEPAIRRAVRFRLVDAGLGAVLDSMDICQSVLHSFFVRAASGQYEIEQPEQLLKLLVTMARNKLTSQARKEQAERRDTRRTVPLGPDSAGLISPLSGPGNQVAARELLQETYRRLSAEERELVELRNEGRNWDEIATLLGEGPVVLRKRLSRALDRVTRQLGLEEGNDE
jgi:RNA polymerase sigma factor (sigma-70 family)